MNWNKLLGVAVVVSVVVNLLLAGFIIGRMIPEQRFMRGYFADRSIPEGGWSGERMREFQRNVERDVQRGFERNRQGGDPRGQIGDLNIFAGAMALSGESRQTVRRVARAHAGELREAIEDVRENRRELLDLLAQEPQDLDRISAKFDELSGISAMAQRRAQQVVLDIARQLPPEERAAFLRGASRQPSWGENR